MNSVLLSLISTLCFSFKSRAALQAEILALRHLIAVLQQASTKRARLRPGVSIVEVMAQSRRI
jgi:hypothetical protein